MDIELKQIDEKIIQIYSEGFKRKVINEYLSTGIPKMDLLRKYGIKTKSGIVVRCPLHRSFAFCRQVLPFSKRYNL